MRFQRILQYAIGLGWILMPMVGCGAPYTSPAPIPETATPIVEAIEVDAGGFSFRPIAGLSVEVEESQATMASQDERISFVLAGRSSCEVKPLQDVIDAFVHMFAQRSELVFKPGEPYAINVASKEGLAVDITGRNWLNVHKLTGRVILVAPTASQYFFALASVLDSAGGDRWGAEEEEIFEAVMDSVTFFEPASASNPFPCFVNHEPPELASDPELFIHAGCWYDKSGRGTCQYDSPLTELGCNAIGMPYGGLATPITWCSVTNNSGCGFSYFCHPDICTFCYLAFQDDQFVLIETEDGLRKMFAPIETGGEALSYVLAVTAGRLVWGGPLGAYYALELDPGLEYFVDIVEDTHVETVADGYLVQLNYYSWHCGASHFHPTFYAIDVLVTRQAEVKSVDWQMVYHDLYEHCIE